MARKRTSWWDVYASGMDAAATAFRVGETMLAADSVIRSRVQTMHSAACDPLSGDYAELTTMVLEKVDAFSLAGQSLLRDAGAIREGANAQFRHAAGLVTSGRVPTAKDMTKLAARSAKMTDSVVGAAGRALLPIHARATANAKRLKKKNRGR